MAFQDNTTRESGRAYRRRAFHSGTWYSNDERVLDHQLTGWIEAASPRTVTGTSRAIIAPHAGLSYSGETAGFAYSHMDPAGIATIFVLGPSHHVHLRGCAVSKASCLETPLGDLPVNHDITQALLASGQFEAMTQHIDEEEHSIEMHLPFIKKVMEQRSVSVVPILVGALSERREEFYGRVLAPYMDDSSNFFVISSDFCHWGSRFRFQAHDPTHGAIHDHIHWLDHQGMMLIQAQNALGFGQYLAEHGNTICGRHPIAFGKSLGKKSRAATVRSTQVFMNAINMSSTNFSVAWVKYAQSSKVVSPQESSVSYASAVVTDFVSSQDVSKSLQPEPAST